MSRQKDRKQRAPMAPRRPCPHPNKAFVFGQNLRTQPHPYTRHLQSLGGKERLEETAIQILWKPSNGIAEETPNPLPPRPPIHRMEAAHAQRTSGFAHRIE